MAASSAQLPKDIPLCRTRGDTKPFTFVLQDSSGTVIDITGRTYLLSVDTREEPDDVSTQLFQLTGVVAVGTDGRVTFTLSVPQSDQTPSEYFYDVQETDTGGFTKTIVKSTYTVAQDITK